MDTVHPRGSFAQRFKLEDGKLYAPGVFDMPAYGEKLTPAALADLVSYLLTLNGSQP